MIIMIIKSRAYRKTSLPWENCQSQLGTDLNPKKEKQKQRTENYCENIRSLMILSLSLGVNHQSEAVVCFCVHKCWFSVLIAELQSSKAAQRSTITIGIEPQACIEYGNHAPFFSWSNDQRYRSRALASFDEKRRARSYSFSRLRLFFKLTNDQWFSN